jgi:hypothetical protein
VDFPPAASSRGAETEGYAHPIAAKPKALGAPRPGAQSQSARAACDPPYSIDADGMKHYKASCLP